MDLCKGGTGAQEYIQYRFGSLKNVELEFPKNTYSTFSKFTFSSYLRGGLAENEGLDANYLGFKTIGVTYEISEERSASDTIPRVGINVSIEKSGKTTRIIGIPSTITGTMMIFRNDERLNHAE